MEEWTGNLIGRMHNARVTYAELGAELGWGKAYVSMILNCTRSPAGAQDKMERAFDAIVKRREGEKYA